MLLNLWGDLSVPECVWIALSSLGWKCSYSLLFFCTKFSSTEQQEQGLQASQCCLHAAKHAVCSGSDGAWYNRASCGSLWLRTRLHPLQAETWSSIAAVLKYLVMGLLLVWYDIAGGVNLREVICPYERSLRPWLEVCPIAFWDHPCLVVSSCTASGVCQMPSEASWLNKSTEIQPVPSPPPEKETKQNCQQEKICFPQAPSCWYGEPGYLSVGSECQVWRN